MNKRLKINLAIFILLILLFALFSGFGTVDMAYYLERPTLSHPFGCDTFGRDLLARVSLGSLISIGLAFCITVLSTILGVLFAFFMAERGMISFFAWGLSNTFKSLSSIILALFLSSIFGSGFLILIVSISISQIPNIARVAYSRIVVVKNEEFCLASLSCGMNKAEIAIFHIIPHIKDEVLSQSLGIFSSSILSEASLSFLGAGIPILYPSLGSIMAEGRNLIISHPRLIIIPSVVLFLITLLINQIGKSLDFDP